MQRSFLDLLDPFGTAMIAVQRMLDVGIPQFERFGQQLVMDTIVVSVVIMFVRMIGGAHRPGSTPGLDLITIIVKGVVVSTIVTHYRTIIPGYNYSFIGMIDSQFHSWMVTLGRGTTERMWMNIDLLWGKVIPPSGGIFGFIPASLYSAGMGLVVVSKALTVLATLYGLIGQSLTRLFGPVALAFLLVPRLNQLSWNWLWTYLNFSFMPVVGMAYIFIMADFVGKAVMVTPDNVTEIGYYSYLGDVFAVLFIFLLGIPLIWQVSRGITGGSGSGMAINPFK